MLEIPSLNYQLKLELLHFDDEENLLIPEQMFFQDQMSSASPYSWSF